MIVNVAESDPTLAVMEYWPPTLLAVNEGAVATPLESVGTVAEVTPPLKVAPAPPVSAFTVNVMGTF